VTDPSESFVRPHVAAGVLFLDDDQRVLMVVPSYKDYLDIPGGYVHAGEPPQDAALREVSEELGIVPPIGRLLVADWWNESTDAHGGPKLLFVFDGGRLTLQHERQIAVDGTEVVDFAYHPVAALADVTIPRLANRIEHAVAARRDGTTAYLQDGRPATGLRPGSEDRLRS